jgi:hypothetical protein
VRALGFVPVGLGFALVGQRRCVVLIAMLLLTGLYGTLYHAIEGSENETQAIYRQVAPPSPIDFPCEKLGPSKARCLELTKAE